ncbi:MAG: transglutaminase-like domain-containing protein [Bacteroidales bacterium]|nr:transglutaminase-like domain-containing protein [Bacteroidales bacterium]
MKIKFLYIVGLLGLMSCAACSGGHVIGESDERAAVERDFEARVESFDSLGVAGELFGIFDAQLSTAEREALEFLYAYMPLADIADHDGEYFLENVRSSFRARREMKWGRSVPEREFRHFVLPIRVNNEDLDESRMVFYDELKDRVAGLSMRDAVLEVNHWCHEKVIYTPSDARTTSPLASVRTANGRCGEESTFTVAALRAVGIPARQVYTPRWAHTDDNHAWVEAWVDGQWYFFGACEPEPVLNLAWFNAPASRGMLMHTRVFGAYHGPEDVVRRTARNTEINVTDNYATTASVSVQVLDVAGEPVEGATVEFKLYNYAEFYTVATRITDAEGRSSLAAGKGDLLVWAYKDGMFGYAKASFGTDSEVTVALEHVAGSVSDSSQNGSGSGASHGGPASGASEAWSFGAAGIAFSQELDIVPPPESANLPEVTPEQRAENDRRMAVEDSIRNAYVATFMTDAAAREFAEAHGFSSAAGSAKLVSGSGVNFSAGKAALGTAASQVDLVARILVASRGNHEQICKFLESLDADETKAAGLDLLQQVSGKDLRDVPCEVLTDHLVNTRLLPGFQARGRSVRGGLDPQWYGKYVLNPRISTELLTAYKGFLQGVVPEENQQAFVSDPSILVSWVAENIHIDPVCNLGACPISPEGVWKARTADPHSRDIFFVALARTLGLPARLDEVTGKVQILGEQGPIDVDFESAEQTVAPTGRLVARYTPVAYLSDPRYYSHFSISRVNPDGSLRLMTYNEGELDMGGGTSWGNLLKNGSTVEAGDYLLVTGTRLAGGSVLSTMTFYTVEPGKTTTLDLVMRESNEDIKVIGSFDSESKYLPLGDVAQLSGASAESGSDEVSAAGGSSEVCGTGSSESCGVVSGSDDEDEDLTSVLLTTGRGYYIVGLLGAGQEPTNHALRDIAAVAGQFEDWGRRIVLIFPSEEQYSKFRPEEFPGLPSTVSFGIDVNGAIAKEITGGTELPNKTTLPIFIIGDTFNRVVFVSQGYTIGLGEQLLNVIHKL